MAANDPSGSPGRDPGDEWTKHAEGARRLARGLVFDAHGAEDVAQESLRIAWERPPGERRPMWAWLAGIVRNVARNRVRSDRRRREREREAGSRTRTVATPDELAQRLESQRRAIEAVLSLEEPYRSTLILRYFEDLPPPEVAARLDVPLETVRTRLQRALARLRVLLDESHGGDRRRWVLALAPLDLGRGPAAAASVALGGLAVKKLLVALAAVLLVGFGGWWAVERIGAREVTDPDVATISAGPAAPVPGGAPILRGRPPADLRGDDPTGEFPPSIDRDLDLHGVVVDDRGVPIAGAKLAAVTFPWERSWDVERAEQERREGDTTSGPDGTFAIRLTRGASVHLRAEAPGRARVEHRDVAAGARVRVVLGPPVRLVVTVTEEEGGAPLHGAEVRFWQGGGRMVGVPEVPLVFRRAGTTGEGGVVVFEGLPGAVWGHLTVRASARGDTWTREYLPASGEHAVAVASPRGRAIEGRVTDAATGEPLPGAVVGADWAQHRSVRTEADGSFSFRGWTSLGTAVLTASAEGYVSESRHVGSLAKLDFPLERGATVAGRVVDASGAPVPGASVVATLQVPAPGRYFGRPPHAETDIEGRFRLGGVHPQATGLLEIESERRGATHVTLPPPSERAGAFDLGDVVLATPRRVEGVVADSDGNPVPGVSVRIPSHAEVRTDDLGRFRFPAVPPGRRSVLATAEGRESQSHFLVVDAADVLDVRFVFAAGRQVRVELVAPAAAEVAATAMLKGSDGVEREVVFRDGVGVVVAPPGEAWLRAHAWPKEWSRPDGVRIAPEQSEVRLVVPASARLAGTVRTEYGAPLADAWVVVTQGDRPGLSLRADAQGRFETHVLPEEPVAIEVRGVVVAAGGGAVRFDSRPFDTEPVRVAPGAPDVVLTVRAGRRDRTLPVEVVGPRGEPISGVAVRVRDGGTVLTGEDGVAVLERVSRSRVLLSVGASKGPLGDLLPVEELRVEADAGGVRVVLRQGVRIRVRATLDGLPAPHAVVRASHEDREVGAGSDFLVDPEAAFPLRVHVSVDTPQGPRARTVVLDRPPAGPVEVALE